ncbi:MAG: queuosine precursor transporter [bacterium]|nr:queuosine precursor transporter [bacterium]
MNQNALNILTSLFVGSLVIASVLASKLITVFGLFVPAGVLAYSVTFACTDIVSETYGKEAANRMVFGGFIALLVVLGLVQLGLIWPPAPFWKHGEAFKTILGGTSRIIIGSVVAYVVSQYHDVWMFHLLRKKTNGKHLWLRNNASTIVSQFIDSVIFVTIAFYGVHEIWHIVWGQWVIKILIGIIDTPVVYGVSGWIKKTTYRGAGIGDVIDSSSKLCNH